nr:molybdopterin molybdotransferase MoeA [Candidatus Njordarchaeum guaymaensis]
MGFHEIKQRISVEAALKLIHSRIAKAGVEEVSVGDSLGRIVSSNIRSKVDVPHFVRSAMDGFAVVASDTFGCTQQKPAKLEVHGECRIGETLKTRVISGKAVEVATGSQLPNGADAVVKVENTSRSGNTLMVFFPVTPGENISEIGEDVKKGEVVVELGQPVRPQDISILLACGVLKISVAKCPTAGVIATGNELVEPGNTPIPGKVFDVNSYTLSAYVSLYGGKPVNLGIVGDSFEELRSALDSATKYDLVIFSGGTSVGKMDMLPDVVSSTGEILFRGVSMRPGGPTTVGLVRGKPVFLLPGFPVASMVVFDTLVGPTIRKMMGARYLDPRGEVTAILGNRVASTIGRRDYVRVRLELTAEGVTVAHPVRTSGSGIISSMTRADGLIEIPEDSEGMEKGSKVKVKLFPK